MIYLIVLLTMPTFFLRIARKNSIARKSQKCALAFFRIWLYNTQLWVYISQFWLKCLNCGIWTHNCEKKTELCN